jgi:hypothetical protein
MSYEILQAVTKNNRTYRKFKPIGVLRHETATPGATDERESAYFDTTTRKAMVHLFVDWNSITQKVPVDEIVWGAGPSANSRYIQFEMCHVPHNVSRAEQERMFKEVWKRSVWLSAYLLVNYVGTTIVSNDTLPTHHMATDKWHETDHTDPDAYFREYGKDDEDFLQDVRVEVYNMTHKTPEVISIPLTVIPSTLHCRKEPTTLSGILKDFHRGDFITAVQSAGEWWKLDVNGTPGYVFKQYTKDR